MTSVTKEGEKTIYEYDCFNRRILKTVHREADGFWQPIECKRMVFQGENEVAIFDTLGVAQCVRVLGISLRGGAEIAAAIAIELKGKVYAPIHDLQGNVCCLVDSDTGQVAASYRYSAFGQKEEKFVDGLCQLNPWQWNSKHYDSESGLIFFGKRYYSPKTARWTSTDPLGNAFGPNLYAFISGRPLTLFDLYGLLPEEEMHWTSYREAPLEGDWLRFSAPVVDSFLYHVSGYAGFTDHYNRADLRAEEQNVSAYVATYRRERSSVFFKGDFHVEGRRLILVNGMLCSRDDFTQRVEKTSKMLGGEIVYGCYNATHGLVPDFIETIFQKSTILTHPVKKLAKLTRNACRDVGPEGNVWIGCHSQGVEITWGIHSKLDYAELQKVSTYSFGGARIIPNNIYKKSYNFASSRDIVPIFADPIGYAAGRLGLRHLEILPSCVSGIDHAMEGDTYQEIFNEVLREYKRL